MNRTIALVLLAVGSIAGSVTGAVPTPVPQPEFLSKYRSVLPSLLNTLSNVEAKGELRRQFDEGGYSADFVLRAQGNSLLLELTYDPDNAMPDYPTGHVYCFGDGHGFTLRRTGGGHAFEGGGRTADDARMRFKKYHRFGRFLSSSVDVAGRRLLDVLDSPASEYTVERNIAEQGDERIIVSFSPQLWLETQAVKMSLNHGTIELDPGLSFAIRKADLEFESVSPKATAASKPSVEHIRIDVEYAPILAEREIRPKRVTYVTTTTKDDGTPWKSVDEATFSAFKVGIVREGDFLPSHFGLPDHLVTAPTTNKAAEARGKIGWLVLAVLFLLVSICSFVWIDRRRPRL